MLNESQVTNTRGYVFANTKQGVMQIVLDPEDMPKAEGITGRWGIFKNSKGQQLARAGKKDGQVFLHKLIVDIPKGHKLEWINEDSLDLRKENLQLVDRNGNATRLKQPKTNTKSVRGVYFHKGANKWHAAAFHDKKRVSLGYFEDYEAAVAEMNIFREEGPNSPKLKRNRKGNK